MKKYFKEMKNVSIKLQDAEEQWCVIKTDLEEKIEAERIEAETNNNNHLDMILGITKELQVTQSLIRKDIKTLDYSDKFR
jgi:hypothetical protein